MVETDQRSPGQSFKEDVILGSINDAAAKPFRPVKFSDAASTGARFVFSHLLYRHLAQASTTRRGRVGWRVLQVVNGVVGVAALAVVDKVREERERRLATLTDAQRDYLLNGK